MLDYVMVGVLVIVVCAVTVPQLLYLVIPITLIAGYRVYALDYSTKTKKVKPINVNR
jgi:hypothetical protein